MNLSTRIILVILFAFLGKGGDSYAQMFENSLAHPSGNLSIVENKGQWPKEIAFHARLNTGELYFEANRWKFDFVHPDDWSAINSHFHDEEGKKKRQALSTVRHHAYYMTFLNANPQPVLRGDFKRKGYHNYLKGNDPDKWTSRVGTYQHITYESLYDGIDVKVYESVNEQLKYDYIIAPGADPNQIAVQYKGPERIFIGKDGRLNVFLSTNVVQESDPVAYQIINGHRVGVDCVYELNGSTVRYVFPNGYDSNEPLVIDPEVSFSTFSGSSADNWGFTATYDDFGNLYGGGIVFATGPDGQQYDTTSGAFQTTFQGGEGDIGVTKFSADGSELIYATYIGGAGNEQPHSMVVNSAGELYLFGSTSSFDFPIVNTNPAFSSHNGGDTIISSSSIIFRSADIYVARLSADGTSMLSSAFVGGSGIDGLNDYGQNSLYTNYSDDARGEIILDENEDVYVATTTHSSDFGGINGFQKEFAGDQDAVIFKMNDRLSVMNWATYLGGEAADAAYSLKIDASGHVFVTGGSSFAGFGAPFPTTAGVAQPQHGGDIDGYVAKISPDGQTLLASTFIGTPAYDQTYFVETDESQNVYLFGLTNAPVWTVSDDVYSSGNSGQFVVRYDNDLTEINLSTIVDNGIATNDRQFEISPTAFLVDRCGNIYLSGWGNSNGGSLYTGEQAGLPVTETSTNPDGGLRGNYDETGDMYFAVLSKNAESLSYAAYFGGFGTGEHVDGGTSRFDKNGVIYQGICAACGSGSFYTTPGSANYSPSGEDNSNNCNLGVVKIEFDLIVDAVAQAAPSSEGCVPFTVEFKNTSTGAKNFYWDFANGDSSRLENPVYTFEEVGTYNVRLVAVDSATCNISDTTYTLITVVPNTLVEADFSFDKVKNCDSLFVQLTNESTNGGSETYEWTFGDGATSTDTNPNHFYGSQDAYTIELIAIDPNTCNKRDTISKEVSFFPETNYNVSFDTTQVENCDSLNVFFFGEGPDEGDFVYTWDFGDNQKEEGKNVSHAYKATGTYTIQLYLVEQSTCDTFASQPITIQYKNDQIVADFDFVASDFCDSLVVSFSNESVNAKTFIWDFGNGDSINLRHPVYTYYDTGVYHISLTAIDSNNCRIANTFDTIIQFDAQKITADFEFVETKSCEQLDIDFEFTGQFGQSYTWYFGDAENSTSTDINPTFVYTEGGSYDVRLVVEDARYCNLKDEVTKTITFNNDSVVADADIIIQPGCDELIVDFVNKSRNGVSFLWLFGDNQGNTSENISHEYPAFNRPYTIRFIVTDSNTCNISDTLVDTIEVRNVPIVADFLYDSTLTCDSMLVELDNVSENGVEFSWDFGDGNTSSERDPVQHVFYDQQTYIITLIAFDSLNCLKRDTIAKPFIVFEDSVIAGVEFTPNITCEELVVSFTNVSRNGQTFVWSFNGGDPVYTQTTPPDQIYETPGIYSAQLIAIDDRQCNKRDTFNYEIEFSTDELVAGFEYDSIYTCSEFIAIFNDTSLAAGSIVAEYYWDFGDGTSSRERNPTHQFTEDGIYDIKLVVIDSFNCFVRDSVEGQIVFNNDSVIASFETDYDLTCERLQLNLSYNGKNAKTYEWDFGDNKTGALTNVGNISYAYYETGEFEVRLIAIDSNSCNIADTFYKHVAFRNDSIISKFSFEETLTCEALILDVINESVFPIQYEWDFGDGSPIDSTENPDSHVYTDTGIYVVQLVVLDTFNCHYSDTATELIVFDGSLVVADWRFTEKSNCDSLGICAQNSSKRAERFEWHYGNDAVTTESDPCFSFFEHGNHSVQLIAINENLCNKADTQSFSFFYDTTEVVADFSYVPNLDCDNLSIEFINSSTSADSIVWHFGDGLNGKADSLSHTYGEVGTYYLMLTAYNAASCNQADTLFDTISLSDAAIEANFSMQENLTCEQLEVVVVDESKFAKEYLWQATGYPNNSARGPHLYTFFTPGSYTISLTVDDEWNCNGAQTLDTIVVFSDERVEAEFDFDTVFNCDSLVAEFENLSPNGKTYVWDFTYPSISQKVIRDTSVAYFRAGTYTVQLIAIDSALCNIADTFFQTITYNQDTIAGSMTVNVDPYINCDSLVVEVFSDIKNASDFSWDFGDGSPLQNAKDTRHVYDAPGLYVIKLIASNEALCRSRYTISDTVEQLPRKEISFEFTTGCEGAEETFIANNMEADSYIWAMGDGSEQISAATISHVFKNYGTYNVVLTTIDSSRCNLEDSYASLVDVHPTAIVDFTSNPSPVAYRRDEVLFTELSAFGESYLWTFGDGDSSRLPNPAHIYEAELDEPNQTYDVCLEVNNNFNCPNQLCKTLEVLRAGIDVPTAFSPNGDNQNDILFVRGEGVDYFVFKLYNRWGQLIFETTDLNQGWDGIYNGVTQEMEVYNWTLEAVLATNRFSIVSKKGKLTLLR